MYLIGMTATIYWAPDGAQSDTVPTAQSLEISLGDQTATVQPWQIVPGGNAPTAGNVNTALLAAAATVSTAMQTKIAQIDGWASGGN